jgi:hypothetical protein
MVCTGGSLPLASTAPGYAKASPGEPRFRHTPFERGHPATPRYDCRVLSGFLPKLLDSSRYSAQLLTEFANFDVSDFILLDKTSMLDVSI